MVYKIIYISLALLFSINLFGQGKKKVYQSFYGSSKLLYANGEFGIVRSDKGLWGIKNEQKPKKTKFEYEALHYLHKKDKDYYLAKKNQKWGVIDKSNSEILPFIYTFFSYSDRCKCHVVEANKKWGALSLLLEELLPVSYDDLWIKDDLIMVKKEGKWGMVRNNGEALIPISYQELVYAKWTRRFIAKNANKYGVFNDSFQLILPIVFDTIQDLEISYKPSPRDKYKFDQPFRMYFFLEKDGKYGISDGNGIVEQEPIYDHIKLMDHKNRFKERFYLVKKDNLNGVCMLGKKGLLFSDNYQEIKPIVIDTITHFLVKKDEYYGILKKDGTIFYDFVLDTVVARITPTVPPLYLKFLYGFTILEQQNKWGVINKDKEIIIPFDYDSLYVGPGILMAKKDDKLGAFTKKCKKLLSCDYDSISVKMKSNFYPENLILVKKNDRIGYAKWDGTFLAPPKYQVLKGYAGGLARFKRNDKWGFIDPKGVEVIPPIYDSVKSFKYGKAQATLEGKTIYIDKAGKEVE